MISYEEFKNRVYSEFSEANKKSSAEEINNFLKDNEERIRSSYDTKKDNYTGSDEFITSGLVYALNFEF